MKQFLLTLSLILISTFSFSQDYVSYFTGNETNVEVDPTAGVCLMGGATENDEAMRWFLNRANGGDVLVLRASGSDGYNDYFYSDLNVTLNSVETILILNDLGATDPYVLDKVTQAEAIWFAGGDQFDYVTYFKDNAMEDALQHHISIKQGVIGGTSAGMAILGAYYFDAANGTVTSQQAIANPYTNRVSIGRADFLEIPFLEQVITDTHYDDPDRRGRHTAFLARIIEDENIRALGLASEEFTSICIDENGIARAFGSFPEFEDYVYFVQPICENFTADQCLPGQPLLWQEGVRAFKVPATNDGVVAMDMSTWQPLTETGEWLQWNIEEGATDVNAIASEDPMCFNLTVENQEIAIFQVYPNPAIDSISVGGASTEVNYSIYSMQGNLLKEGISNGSPISVASFTTGVYFIKITTSHSVTYKQFLKE